MAITLSDADLTELELALSLFLSPLRFEQLTDWRRACRTRLERLLKADRSISGLFMEGEPIGEAHPDQDAAVAAYLAHYGALDYGFRDRRREIAAEIYTRPMLYGPEHARSEFYNDWIVPYGLDDGFGMGIGTSASGLPEAFFNFYHSAQSHQRFGKREVAFLRLLLPAFKAGMHTCRAFGSAPGKWVQAFDGFDEAAMVKNAHGTEFRTRAFQRLLEGDPERDVLLRAVAQTADAVVGLRRHPRKTAPDDLPHLVYREVLTRRARYRLRGAYLPDDAGLPMTVVAVDRVTPELPTDDQLFVRFKLTVRESQVARLLATGHANDGVACELGISPRTAQHHTERVLAKLGLHTRSAVAFALSRV
jgi:DNA-binding CsgD family transcriptional regulator